MTLLQAYVLFGVPLIGLVLGGVSFLLVRRSARALDARKAGPQPVVSENLASQPFYRVPRQAQDESARAREAKFAR